MLDPKHPLAELLRRDDRYHFDSYVFIFDSLRYAEEKLNMGRVAASSALSDEEELSFGGDHDAEPSEAEIDRTAERHISGQELCEAIRRYALSQYGLLAKSVLNHWGINSTGDFGEIVFNLIDIGQMRKTDNDRREDFDGVYDFDQALADTSVFAEASGSQSPGEERSS